MQNQPYFEGSEIPVCATISISGQIQNKKRLMSLLLAGFMAIFHKVLAQAGKKKIVENI